MNQCVIVPWRRAGMDVLRRRDHLGPREAGGLAQPVKLTADYGIAPAFGLDLPESAEGLLDERLARPDEEAVVFHLAQVGDAAGAEHPARLAQDGVRLFLGNVLEEPRAVDGVERS